MSVVAPARILELARITDKDPKKAYIETTATVAAECDVYGENVIVVTYIGNEMTKGKIIRPLENIREDEYQSPTGLIIKVGDGFSDEDAARYLHKWVRFSINSGTKFHYDGVPVRDIPISLCRGSVKDPSKVR